MPKEGIGLKAASVASNSILASNWTQTRRKDNQLSQDGIAVLDFDEQGLITEFDWHTLHLEGELWLQLKEKQRLSNGSTGVGEGIAKEYWHRKVCSLLCMDEMEQTDGVARGKLLLKAAKLCDW